MRRLFKRFFGKGRARPGQCPHANTTDNRMKVLVERYTELGIRSTALIGEVTEELISSHDQLKAAELLLRFSGNENDALSDELESLRSEWKALRERAIPLASWENEVVLSTERTIKGSRESELKKKVEALSSEFDEMVEEFGVGYAESLSAIAQKAADISGRLQQELRSGLH